MQRSPILSDPDMNYTDTDSLQERHHTLTPSNLNQWLRLYKIGLVSVQSELSNLKSILRLITE